MPIKLDYELALRRFAEALALARSDATLPLAWVGYAEKLSQSPAKTFPVMLGTALLAKATNPRVDPFSLKTRKIPNAYSARSLCKDVLVPCAVEARINLGTTGREPLNNQPFFRFERVAPDMVVRESGRPYLDVLCSALKAAEPLGSRESLEALAAFLRVRMRADTAAPPVLAEEMSDIQELADTSSRFIAENPEHGKRGQAFLAACLSLVFDEVKTARVFDPSRHIPGDVSVSESGVPTLAAESKQRPTSSSEVLQFVARCREVAMSRAIVATLDPRQPPLDVNELRGVAWRDHGVHLSVMSGAAELLLSSLTWTSKLLDEAVREFPLLMAARLAELEVSNEGQQAWARNFASRSE
jgi:hypothetical protein